MKGKFFILCGFALSVTFMCHAQTSIPNQIIGFLKKNYGTASETSRHFIYNAADLNGDGKDEYLIGLIVGDWC